LSISVKLLGKISFSLPSSCYRLESSVLAVTATVHRGFKGATGSKCLFKNGNDVSRDTFRVPYLFKVISEGFL